MPYMYTATAEGIRRPNSEVKNVNNNEQQQQQKGGREVKASSARVRHESTVGEER